MCYIITMTMWVKLAILDSLPFIVIYLVSGNLFFIWCLFLINSFNMGEYGVKITVISFVIAEHLWGLPKEKKKSDSFILGFLQVLHSGDRFFSTCYIVSWNLTIPALVMLSFQFIVKWEMKSVEGSASGTVEEKITREGRWSSDSYHRWEGRTPWLSVATKVPRLLPVAFFFNGYGLR